MIRKWLILSLGVVTVALCFLLVEILGRSPHGAAPRNAAIAVLVVLVAAVVLVIAFALVASFQRRESRRKSIFTIAVAYATLIVTFASIYYVLAAFSDYDDAVAKVVHYSGRHAADPDGIPYRDLRAFKGIDERLWSGVDWLPNVSNDRDYSVREMRQEARKNHVVQFLPRERAAVFFQCLHLSIATITSTGYGDITPARPVARFFTDIEMLSGTSLLVVALGIVFSNFWERSEPRN